MTGEVIFLYAEILTRRSPSIWGVGRFTCLLLGTTALIQWVAFAVSDVLRFLSDAGRVPTPQHLAEAAVFHSHLPVFYELSLLPAALWLAVAIGKIPRPESRDGREWCGRIFGLLVLFTRLASELINWLGYGFWLH